MRNINCATPHHSISAQHDFRLGAFSRIEQGSFYSIGRPRSDPSKRISPGRIGNFLDGVEGRGPSEQRTSYFPLMSSPAPLDSLARILTYGRLRDRVTITIVIPTGANTSLSSIFTLSAFPSFPLCLRSSLNSVRYIIILLFIVMIINLIHLIDFARTICI